jgi:hypothetical protein
MVDSLASYHSGRCRDVSAGGLSLWLNQRLEVGTRLEVYFELPTGVAVETTAEVVRTQGHMVAVAFLEIDAKTRAALVAYCEMSGVRRIVLHQQSAP